MSLLHKLVLGLFVAIFVITGCSAASAPNPSPSDTPAAQSTDTAVPTATTAPTATAEATATTAATATSLNPLAAIANSVNSFGEVKSYRMTVTIQGSKTGKNGTFMMEVAGANGYHISSPKGEFYVIGNTFYVRQGANGQWSKFTANNGSSVTAPFLAPRNLVSKATATKNVSLVGPDILNGMPMLVYQYTPDPTKDPNTVSAKLWVGVADQLPYQAIANDKDGSTVTVVFSDYNAPITLTPPIP